jgi:hypothetical protein
MLRDHLTNRPNLRTTGGTRDTPWLFPGSHAGKHLDPQSIMHRLRKLGINLLGARDSAIQNLAAEVPRPSALNSSATATKSRTGTPKSPHNRGRSTRHSACKPVGHVVATICFGEDVSS